MTDAHLNRAIAEAMGYTYAGPFRGRDMYHPPGQRTTVVPLPDYTHDWNLLMPLVVGSPVGMDALVAAVAEASPCLQREVCDAVLAALVDDGGAA